MNEVGIKVRKFFLVIQLLAALVVAIGVIVAYCNVDSVSSSLQSAETFFGAVMAVRVGIIITFITSIIICTATYFLTKLHIGKSIGGAVTASLLFVFNFILEPFSSKEKLLSYGISSLFNSMSGGSSDGFGNVSPSQFIWIVVILDIVMMILTGVNFSDDSETETDISVKEKTWVCPNCNTLNSGFRDVCIECGSGKIKPSNDSKAGSWICKSCLAKNSPNSSHCAWCNAKRPTQSSPNSSTEDDSPKKKLCKFCGSEVSGDAEYCEKCAEKKPSERGYMEWKTCSNCGELIPVASLFCYKCGKVFKPSNSANQSACPFCGSEVSGDAEYCEKCGNRLITPTPVEAVSPTVQESALISETDIPAEPPQLEEPQETKPETKICRFCGAEMRASAHFCRNCGKSETEQDNSAEEQTPASTKFCGFCGAEIPADNRFCGMCGKEMPTEKICAKCGAVIPPENNFCGKCGAKYGSDL